jgi:hypothetical protein
MSLLSEKTHFSLIPVILKVGIILCRFSQMMKQTVVQQKQKFFHIHLVMANLVIKNSTIIEIYR